MFLEYYRTQQRQSISTGCLSIPNILVFPLIQLNTYFYILVSLVLIFTICRSSLLDDLPRDEDIHKLFSVLPANNCLTDMTLDSKSGSSDKLSIGSSKYLQTHAFSPSMVWDQGEVAASPFTPFNSKQKYFLPLKVSYPM